MATDKRRTSSASGNHKNSGRTNTSGKVQMSKKAKVKKKKKRAIIIFLEVFVLLLAVVVLYGVSKVEKVEKIEINEDDIVINDTVEQLETLKGYRNIALFGVDARDQTLGKGNRSDTIIIASINEDTKDVRLCSVYRDTYLNLGNDSYNKCNAAYAKGGPEQAINMLNMNLDLNITDYVTIGFSGLIDTINAMGGVNIDVDESEISHLNNYQICMADELNSKYSPVSSTGVQTLDGMQATAYCRIRYTSGDDFKRAFRQREVLTAVADEAKKSSAGTLNQIANDVFPQVSTSLSLEEITSLLGSITDYTITESDGFPFEDYRTTGTIGKKGSCVIPNDLETNVVELHKFLFDDDSYTPSDAVVEYSAKVKSDTSGYVK